MQLWAAYMLLCIQSRPVYDFENVPVRTATRLPLCTGGD